MMTRRSPAAAAVALTLLVAGCSGTKLTDPDGPQNWTLRAVAVLRATRSDRRLEPPVDGCRSR